MSKPILGLQLYSLRREFEADAEGTLRKVRGLGYDYIELAGTYGWSAKRWQELLAETGLKVAGAHAGEHDLTVDLAKTLEFYQALGCHRFAVGWVPDRSVEGYERVAGFLNKAAKELQSHGGEVLYHNHDFEFEPIGGTTGYDVLLKETDPALVKFEVDTYWVERTGRDAKDFLAKHADRVGIIHAKELRRSDQSDQAVGVGDIDFPAIVSMAQEHEWPLIVEFEGEGAIEACRLSAAYLAGLIKAL